VSATGHDSAEPRTDAATAAAWRRRRRAERGLPLPAETDWKHTSSFGETADTPAMSSPDINALDFTESPSVGLNGIFHIASTAAQGPSVRTAAPGASVHTARSSASLLGPLESLKTPRGDSGSASPASAIALSAPVMDRPRANSQLGPMTPGGRPTAEQRPGQRTVWGNSNQLLLIAILTVQAILSIRLVWSNTAFLDEAIYLSAGHVEIAHWLHGTPVPGYATYFSGAPVIYPPIGAIADSIGGLAGARILSLIFMLGTTSLLWSLTSKLFGIRAAVCAAVLFAILGPTLQLGAFATFDAMALFLLAASASCMVWSQDRDDSALLLLAGTVLLVLANATKYTTTLFDPSVVALAGLAIAGKRGPKAAVARSGYVAAGVFGLISALLALGGPLYLAGALYTTVSRAPGGTSALLVLTDSWKWVGLVCVIAAAGVISCVVRHHDRVQVLILTVLAATGILAPLNQARLHTTTSLSKHVDFGAWFAAAAAGYAISRLSQVGRWRSLHLAMTAVVLTVIAIPVGITGRTQASEIFHEWPNSARITAQLRSLTRQYPGHYLAEDYDVPAYYLESTISWQRWSGTGYFSYTFPGASHTLTGLAAYGAAINRHYFSLIIIDFVDTTQTDNEIIADLQQTGSYQVVAVVPSSVGQYTIWAYEPPGESASRDGHH
jgi:hypothetical protein